jgi:hypothetical protein
VCGGGADECQCDAGGDEFLHGFSFHLKFWHKKTASLAAFVKKQPVGAACLSGYYTSN